MRISEELECAFGVVGKILMNIWNLFGKIWIQNVGDIAFQVIFTIEISNKFQKTRFWKEKSVDDFVTLGLMVHATLVCLIQRCICFHLLDVLLHEFNYFDRLFSIYIMFLQPFTQERIFLLCILNLLFTWQKVYVSHAN